MSQNIVGHYERVEELEMILSCGQESVSGEIHSISVGPSQRLSDDAYGTRNTDLMPFVQ
jgi:hypothetical protein